YLNRTELTSWTRNNRGIDLKKSFEPIDSKIDTVGKFGWAVHLPAVSVKTAVAVRLDTVAIL
ncbi:hypothetical protein Goshw_028677, partial [Gossypium schwendimanii]|nr:hypothetical protein [Gossypium schwendimanii]